MLEKIFDSRQKFYQTSSACHNMLRLFGHSINAGKTWNQILLMETLQNFALRRRKNTA